MVQIIKSNRPESTSETFGKAFSNVGKSGAEAIIGHHQQKENQRLFDEENKAIFRETGIDLRGINDQKSREEAFKQALSGKQSQEKESRDRNALLNMQELKHGHAKELQEEKFRLEGKGKQQESNEPQEIAQKSFNRMAELLKGKNLGRGSDFFSFFGGDTAKDVGEFTSLSGALEALLVDKVSKGTLSNTRFEYIKDTLLPKSSDTKAEIEGKMKGLAEMLNLDPSSLTIEKDKSTKTSDKKMSLEEIFG